MPSNETAKTKSAPKTSRRRLTFAIAGGLLIVCLLALGVALASKARLHAPNGHIFLLSRAVTDQEQKRGLGGTPSLAPDRGMLFPYAKAQERCFWMKDMRYSLDIIWVGADKKVTHIEKNLAPSTYPESFCASAQYVIELNAGQAGQTGITKGQTLQF
jgi:uncharacterized membrane protein (UPF0127 family)